MLSALISCQMLGNVRTWIESSSVWKFQGKKIYLSDSSLFCWWGLHSNLQYLSSMCKYFLLPLMSNHCKSWMLDLIINVFILAVHFKSCVSHDFLSGCSSLIIAFNFWNQSLISFVCISFSVYNAFKFSVHYLNCIFHQFLT